MGNLLLKHFHSQQDVKMVSVSNLGLMSDLQKRIISCLKVYSVSIVCHMCLKKCLKNWFHQLIWRNGTRILPVSISKDKFPFHKNRTPSLLVESWDFVAIFGVRTLFHTFCFATMYLLELSCFSMFQSSVILGFT